MPAGLIGFFVGLIVGGVAGLLLAGLCTMARLQEYEEVIRDLNKRIDHLLTWGNEHAA